MDLEGSREVRQVEISSSGPAMASRDPGDQYRLRFTQYQMLVRSSGE